MQRLERKNDLDWLVKWKDRQIIKVVTGVRRCGKSTLFAIYQDYLRAQGVEPQQIIAINFEDLDFEDLTNYKTLYQYVKARLLPDRMNYIFLDEIQRVEGYEKAVDSLFLRENCDLYLTGSNGYFLSGELATLLTGRYVELSMMPLSFKEFCAGLADDSASLNAKFERYIRSGSFPYVLRYGYGEQEAREYMRGIYNTVLLNDIVKRLNVADVNMLEAITRFAMHNIGNRTSPTTIANTMTSQGRKIDPKTVDRYLRGLTDSLLFYEARRYNIKGKAYIETPKKYYFSDLGLRNARINFRQFEQTHSMENVIYNELRMRGYSVDVGVVPIAEKDRNGKVTRKQLEVDFVCNLGSSRYYIQSAYTLPDEAKRTQEVRPFRKIDDSFKKIIITRDMVPTHYDEYGILTVNIYDFLLDPKCLEK